MDGLPFWLVSGNLSPSITCIDISHDIASAGADFIFIPERPPHGDPWEDEMCEAIQRVATFHLSLEVIKFLSIDLGSIAPWENAKPSLSWPRELTMPHFSPSVLIMSRTY